MRPIFRMPTPRGVLFFCALAAAMVLMHLALPQREPAAFVLVCAALACRCDPYAVFLAYVVSSAAAFSPRNSV